MLALPPVHQPSWWRFQIRLGRHHYVRVDTSDYLVDPAAIGRMVAVLCDNDEVTVLSAGRSSPGTSLTDPQHAEAGDVMRREAPGRQDAARSAGCDVVEVKQREDRTQSGPARPATASPSPPPPSGSTDVY